jgi:twitching motility protein PilI
LRSEDQLTPEQDDKTPRPGFVGLRYRDASGRLWQELNLAELAGDEAFLRIVG